MTKMQKISHSAKEKYLTCGKMYDLHYNQKIRSKFVSSALVWGSAIDVAINGLLEGKSVQECNMIFETAWYSAIINNEEIILSSSHIVQYYKADCNVDLLNEDDIKVLNFFTKDSKMDVKSILFIIVENLGREMEFASENDLKLFQKAAWLSLRQKGLMFIKTYSEKIIPLFNEIVKIQVPVELNDESGNAKINGFADFIATLKTAPDVRIIFDNKTASKPYKQDSVETSEQLALYNFVLSEQYNTSMAGYIVLNKNPKKLVHSRTCFKCKKDYSTTSRKIVCDNKKCNGNIYEKSELVIDFQILTAKISQEKESKN